MHTDPFISIIVPIFNTGAYLRECIESIISQSYTDYELILIDDGSTDESVIIESEFAAKYDNISVLHSNSGCVSSARNMGIDYAKGKYILFVDSDDYLLTDSLYILYQATLSFPEADFIQAPFSVLSNGKIINRSKRFDVLDQYANKLWIGCKYLKKNTLAISYPWNSLIKRSFLDCSNVRFNSKLTAQEDLLFILELFINEAKGVLITEPTYVYRFGREGSLTSVSKTLSPSEIVKRKRLLRSLIECSICLKNLIPRAPSIRVMLYDKITENLTGCIGGSALLHPDKEIFSYLSTTFPIIPIYGSLDRRMLALLYNINHNLAYFIRKFSIKNPLLNQ